MMHLEAISDYFSKHNKLARLLLKSLERSDEINIRKSGDSKYSLFFRQEFIESYKTPGGEYTLSIGNKMYDVSNSLSKKIWNLLDEIYQERRFGTDDLEKKFK
jgi:hypothetical protein